MAEEATFINSKDTIILKKAIARLLYSKKIDQLKISEILNLSQPMVSNYCSSNDKIPDKIMNNAEKITDKIIKGSPITFQTCITYSNKLLEGFLFVADKTDLINDEKNKIIENLNEAFLNLKGKKLGNLIPEVKLNIAMAKNNPKNTDDIAAFLNGLILIEDTIAGHNGIRFGKSKHLSNLLLDFQNKIVANSIMNIAYINKIKNLDFTVGYLTKDFKYIETEKQLDILLHKGDFGIEPCAYILGKDAIDVTNKVLKIMEEIKK